MASASAQPHLPRRLRCAIYTRKSTEEGLEQDFNSLDAQREAAEAFILSQRREGWTAVAERFDDGGFSGANMDRPALQRLLAAIPAGKLDCVVVYKVDRLSRSLLDFTRLLSLFEKHNVSFVAVTQQFNTSTSLGRLTLNILLSFAQFERELISERTRDKMSAARKRGKWVGGHPMLGYDVDPEGAGLVINHEEAERVREMFTVCEQLGSLQLTLEESERRGWRLKSWARQSGEFREGARFTLTSLRRHLTNILYAGSIRHKGQIYPGEHEAIVPPELWQRVQQCMAQKGSVRGSLRNRHLALLQGLLHCECCQAAMVYSYAVKLGRKYPYYVCRQAQRQGWASCPSKSLPALGIEQAVLDQLRQSPTTLWKGEEWEQTDRLGQIAMLRQTLVGIGYDGRLGRISIRFKEHAQGAEAKI